MLATPLDRVSNLSLRIQAARPWLWVLWIALAMEPIRPVQGQDSQPDPSKIPANNPAFDLTKEQAQFEELVGAWRKTMSQMVQAAVLFHNLPAAEANPHREQYQQLEYTGRQQFDAIFQQAIRMVENAPRGSIEAAQFLLLAVYYRYEHDWYEGTGEAVEVLLRVQATDPKLAEIAGVSFYATGQLDRATPHLIKAIQSGEMDDLNRLLLGELEPLKVLIQREAESRRQDAEKDDSPRVLLETTRGPIVIELFEDQAPNTVANFIDLVDQGYYDGLPFYQVLKSQVALAGDDDKNHAGTAPFVIADEAIGEDARPLLRGSLAMAKIPDPQGKDRTSVPNTASSQFFIPFRPIPRAHLEFTVFGRVIEGLEHFSFLTRIDPSEKKEENAPPVSPDRIVVAKVLRRRDHSYQPQRIAKSPIQAAAEASLPSPVPPAEAAPKPESPSQAPQ